MQIDTCNAGGVEFSGIYVHTIRFFVFFHRYHLAGLLVAALENYTIGAFPYHTYHLILVHFLGLKYVNVIANPCMSTGCKKS
jgi:hypothetical protein